jgi:hypothetical protein
LKSLILSPTVSLDLDTIKFVKSPTPFLYIEPSKSNYRILTSYPELADISNLLGIGVSTVDSTLVVYFCLPTGNISIPITKLTHLSQVLLDMGETEVTFNTPLLYVEDYPEGKRLTLGGIFSDPTTLSTFWPIEHS